MRAALFTLRPLAREPPLLLLRPRGLFAPGPLSLGLLAFEPRRFFAPRLLAFEAREFLTLRFLPLRALALFLLARDPLTFAARRFLPLRPFPPRLFALDALALLLRALFLCICFRLARRYLLALLLPLGRGVLAGRLPARVKELGALLARQIGEEAGAVAREEKVPRRERSHPLRRFVLAPRVAGTDRRRGRCGNERHVRAAERAVNEGLLPARGAREHVVAHPAEQDAHVEARRRQMLQQRAGERAVRALPVGRDRSGLRGKRDQRVRARHVDLGEPLADRAGRDGAPHLFHEGIVTAGIEDHEPQALGRFDRGEEAIEWNRLVLDVEIPLELGVGRHQIIRAVHLEPMTGVEHDRHVGVARVQGKLADRAPQIEGEDVAANLDHVEADVLEQLGDRGSVVRRVGKRDRVLIARVADDERDAFLRQRARARGAPQGKCDKQMPARAHAVRPRASTSNRPSSAY